MWNKFTDYKIKQGSTTYRCCGCHSERTTVTLKFFNSPFKTFILKSWDTVFVQGAWSLRDPYPVNYCRLSWSFTFLLWYLFKYNFVGKNSCKVIHKNFVIFQMNSRSITGLGNGHPFFSKECNVLPFFPVLYKRTERSLRSFPFFIKERNDLCVLSRSL